MNMVYSILVKNIFVTIYIKMVYIQVIAELKITELEVYNERLSYNYISDETVK